MFTTSESPKYSNLNSPNLLLWFFFCLIKSRVNRSGITQPFLNPNLIFFSNAPQIVCCRIIKKNQNKDLENSNSNILEVPMSWTDYYIRNRLLWNWISWTRRVNHYCILLSPTSNSKKYSYEKSFMQWNAWKILRGFVTTPCYNVTNYSCTANAQDRGYRIT